MIIQQVIERSRNQILNSFLRSKLLGVLLCCFLYDFERCWMILNEVGIGDQIMNTVIENYQIYEEGYDIKLYILTMSKLLQSERRIFSVKLIETMVILLIKQQHDEIQQLENCQLEEEDEDGDWYGNEAMDEYNDDKQEASISMEAFRSNIQLQNEFEQFRKSIHEIKNRQLFNKQCCASCPELIEQLKVMMKPSRLQDLQAILLQTRIQSPNGEYDAPRKIVTVRQRKSKK